MIRIATTDDVDIIMALEKEDIVHPWERNAIEELITNPNQVAIVYADDNNQPLGYVGAVLIVGEAEIGNVCVSSRARRQGIADKLLKALDEYLISHDTYKVFLEVEENNYPAIALYGKNGYGQYNIRKDYYGPGKNALLYSKEYQINPL